MGLNTNYKPQIVRCFEMVTVFCGYYLKTLSYQYAQSYGGDENQTASRGCSDFGCVLMMGCVFSHKTNMFILRF